MIKSAYSVLYFVVIFVGLIGQWCSGCPTCVGKLEANTPVFFADEYYQAQDVDIAKEPVAANNESPSKNQPLVLEKKEQTHETH